MTVFRHKGTQPQPIDLHQLETMLSFIPADTARGDWVENLMAIKSEFGDAGQEVARQWSQTDSRFKPTDFMAAWKSIKAGGAVTIATLIKRAKDNGFQFAPMTAADRHRIERDAKARQLATAKAQQQEAAQLAEQHKRKARQAHAILKQAIHAPVNHPYLVRKQIDPHGILYGTVSQYKDSLIIPVMGTQAPFESELQSLQFILPKKIRMKDGEMKDKFMMKGGKKSGGFYPIQWVQDAPIVICEGFATGATLAEHYTPFNSVICAFDAGNLMAVAKAFRKWHPQAEIIIAGDNDHLDKQGNPTKHNTGKIKAFEAAQAVAGSVSLPYFDDWEDGSDWNDRYLIDQTPKHGAQYPNLGQSLGHNGGRAL